MRLSIGEAVPNFEVAATGDQTIKLSDCSDKTIILYFYPKDHTPGCTQEGLDFSRQHDTIQALDARILGVSRDSVRTHENFKAKQEFPFDLLSDPDEILCELFGVIKLKNMFGKQVRGIERSTFLIDQSGKLAFEWRKVKVKGHVDEIVERLRALSRV